MHQFELYDSMAASIHLLPFCFCLLTSDIIFVIICFISPCFDKAIMFLNLMFF